MVTAWLYRNEYNTSTIWHVDPIANGYLDPDSEEAHHLVPLEEGWDERFNEFCSKLGEKEYGILIADGEYEVGVTPDPPPEPEEPRTTWNDLADAARAGVNSV